MEKPIPHVLIVDDDPNIIGTVNDILKIKGFEPFSALTGRQALTMLDGHQFDVALIDLRLGDISGLDVLREVKARSPETECILLTGHATQNSAIDAIQLGAFGYFQKPFDVDQILLSIQRAVERREAGEALKISEARFHALIQHAADLIVVINAKGVILYASPSSEHIMGYSPQECLGRNFMEWVHPEDMHIALTSLASRAKTPGTAQDGIEIRSLHKSGTWRVLEVFGTNLLAEPSVHGIVMNMRDITERKHAEEQLHKSEERFRALIEHSSDAVLLLDANGDVKYESPSAERILDHPTHERVGANVFELVDDENLASHKDLFRRVLQNPNLPIDTVFRYLHKDMTHHWAEATLTNLLNEPNVNAIVVNYRDITERRQTGEALRQSEKRYRGLFEDTPVAIWEEDFSGAKKYLTSLKQQGVTDFGKYFVEHPDAVLECAAMIKVLDVNNAALKMYGAESKEILIKATDQVLSDGERIHIHEDFIAIAEGRFGNSWEGSDEKINGDPIEISLSWSVAPGCEDDFSRVIVTTLDITERKRAEDALRRNEGLLSEAQRVGKIGHWEWFAPGDDLICSDEASNILDLPLTEHRISQKALIQMIHPDDRKNLQDMDSKIMAQRLDLDLEYRIILSGGRLRWIHQQAKISYGADGQPQRMIGIVQDITERKLADEALHKSDEQYRLLANNISDVIWILDMQTGHFTYVSPSVEQLRGYTAAEVLAQDLSEAIMPESLARIQKRATEHLGEAERGILVFYRDEVEQPCKDGTTVWTETNTHYVFNQESGHWEVYGVSRNISDRKQAEEQLQLQSSALNAAANSIMLTDISGTIKWVNPAFSQLTGYTLEEAIGKNPRELINSGEHDQAFYKGMWNTILSGQGWHGEIINRRKDGKHYAEELTITPLKDRNGEINHFIAIQQDISARKQAEEVTRQQSEQIRLLYEASQKLNRTLDLKEIYQAICDFMSTIAVNDGLVISAFDPQTKLITCRAFWMNNNWLDVSPFPPLPLEEEGRGTQSIAIHTGQSMLINDYQAMMETARHKYYVDGDTNLIDTEVPPDEEVTRSALIVPLKTGGVVNGVIQVLSYRLNAYDETQLKMLEALSLHIASAEQNARLYAQVQTELNERRQADEATHQRVAELGLLYASGLAFSQLLNPKEIAQEIIKLLEQKMDWHHTAIRLYDMETKTLQLLAFNQPNLVSVEEIAAAEEQLKVRVTRLDQGLSGWAIQHEQTVRSNDLTTDARYVESLPGMQSGLYVPIKLGERVIGVISIESEKANAFAEADERLVNTLANQAASAFENARLFDETRQRIMELTALHRTGQTLLAARLNPEQIYAAVHQAVIQTMPCEAFTIVLEDEDLGQYYAVYFFDKGKRYLPERLPRDVGISGRVISTGETILIDDVETMGDLQAVHFGSMESTRSILAVPLRRGNIIAGMLSTQSYQPHAYGESQRVLLETITAQLSSALDNAHLYQQTQARINELETLHVISTSLRTIQTTNEVLAILLDNTLAALGTDTGAILLHDPATNELHDVAARGWFATMNESPIQAGEGVAGTVFATGEAYFSREFIRDGVTHVSLQENIPAGWGGVCLPIRTSTEIIGVLFISVQLPQQINMQQMRLLESLVDMAGAALHRMRLHNETARRAEEFASLYETSKVLSAEYDLNSLLRVIVERAKEMLHAATSGMYLYHLESQELELMMDTSLSIPLGLRLKFGEGMAGKVAQTRLPLRIDDYSTWEGRSPKFDGTLISAVIEVPMLYAGELIGVLTADEGFESTRKFTEADERLLSLFASQAAGAINSARHHEDTIHHAEELEHRVMERTAEINAARQRLDLATSAGGIGVWDVNLKDSSVFWDARMFLIHGISPDDFNNSLDAWWQLIHPQDVPLAQSQFELALQQTGLFVNEHRITLHDGSMRSVSAKAIVLYDADHQPERMIGVNMDVTERKQAEEAMHRANFEMERALRIKDEFLANMSHELRTPLNAILGISESLEEQFVGALNEKQLKYTGIIRESGRHLLELINDILDISKIEAGRMELELQNLSVEKICQSSLRMIKELAQKKSLGVSFEVKGNVKTLLGDERRLKQALVNLLGNAVKFTPQGGAIGLEVEGHIETSEITFTVWDKGVGIAQEDIQYLFKPFVQLDSGLAREYQGTGLGLALVAQMIRLHGGSVHVESVLGQGSRFIITLPWKREQQDARLKLTGELPPLSLKSSGKRNGKILLVEDTNVVITLMSEYLLFKGYTVLVAQNGYEGVMLAKQEHPDLILMDVMMPVMDGMEATKQIRLDPSLQKIPIIALTALAMAGDRELCLAAGMNDYMSKPIKMQELSEMIEKYMGSDSQSLNSKLEFKKEE